MRCVCLRLVHRSSYAFAYSICSWSCNRSNGTDAVSPPYAYEIVLEEVVSVDETLVARGRGALEQSVDSECRCQCHARCAASRLAASDSVVYTSHGTYASEDGVVAPHRCAVAPNTTGTCIRHRPSHSVRRLVAMGPLRWQ